MENGWIKLYRNLMSDCIWQNSTASLKVVMVTILMMANHEEKEWLWNGQKFKCKPGQMVTSIAAIKANCGDDISDGAVRCALKKLEKYGFITNVGTKTGRLITIVNWGKYQGSNDNNKGVTPNNNKNNNENDKREKNVAGTVQPNSELPAWKSEGFSSEENYIKFLRGEISEIQ